MAGAWRAHRPVLCLRHAPGRHRWRSRHRVGFESRCCRIAREAGSRMIESRTYLDHNATEPLRPEARKAMLAAMDVFGNPSSVHREGRAARAIVEAAREQVAALVNAKPGEIVFTSGATEANTFAITGQPWGALLYGCAE